MHFKRSLAIAAIGCLVLAGSAGAATPRRGGLYTGVLHAGVEKPITLRVSSTGTTAYLVWYCGTQRQLQHINAGHALVHIRLGAFHWSQYPGQRLGFAVSGRFTTTTRVSVHLQPYTAACTDQVGGTTTLILHP